MPYGIGFLPPNRARNQLGSRVVPLSLQDFV